MIPDAAVDNRAMQCKDIPDAQLVRFAYGDAAARKLINSEITGARVDLRKVAA